ncbi:hypothetical protein CL622_08300 [archaeon]|nr:hypothetical protein [archaeon]
MKDLKELTVDDIKDLSLVVFDVDGVIVPRGTKILAEKNRVTYDLKYPPQRFIDLAKKLLDHVNVAISSGRSMLTIKNMFGALVGMESANHSFILQGENGGRINIIADEVSVGHKAAFIHDLYNIKEKLMKITDPNLSGLEPKETILTIHCKERVPEIESVMKDYPYYCLWNGEAYDIGAADVNKGTGLVKIGEYLTAHKKINADSFKAIAIGDRQNDIDLLKVADISVSADPDVLKDADFGVFDANFTDPDKLPGVLLAQRLVELFEK